MKILLLLSLFVPFSIVQPKCEERNLQQLVKDSDLIVVAEVIEVDPKAYLFGDLVFLQRVRYHVRTVLKGNPTTNNIDVGHDVMTKNSPTVEPGERRLSNAFFQKGNKYILFLAPDPAILREGKKNKTNGAFLAFNPNCSVMKADDNTIALVNRLLGARQE